MLINVIKDKISTKNFGDIPDMYALVREDTGLIFGIVSDRYQIINNKDIIDSMMVLKDPLLLADDFVYNEGEETVLMFNPKMSIGGTVRVYIAILNVHGNRIGTCGGFAYKNATGECLFTDFNLDLNLTKKMLSNKLEMEAMMATLSLVQQKALDEANALERTPFYYYNIEGLLKDIWPNTGTTRTQNLMNDLEKELLISLKSNMTAYYALRGAITFASMKYQGKHLIASSTGATIIRKTRTKLLELCAKN